MERKIIEDCIRFRRPLPDAIRDAPELELGLELYYLAFADLTSCRQLGESVPGPISWSDIQRYCEVYGITGEQREDVFYHVQTLDKVYLDHAVDKFKKSMQDAKSKGKRRGRS